MAATGTSSSSLHIEECDFEQNIFLVLFSCMKYYLTAKYKTKKLFSNFTAKASREIALLFKTKNLNKGQDCFIISNFSFTSPSCYYYAGLLYSTLLRLLIKVV